MGPKLVQRLKISQKGGPELTSLTFKTLTSLPQLIIYDLTGVQRRKKSRRGSQINELDVTISQNPAATVPEHILSSLTPQEVRKGKVS